MPRVTEAEARAAQPAATRHAELPGHKSASAFDPQKALWSQSQLSIVADSTFLGGPARELCAFGSAPAPAPSWTMASRLSGHRSTPALATRDELSRYEKTNLGGPRNNLLMYESITLVGT